MNLTHDEIDKMEAGPELDALIAEKVMGWNNKMHGGEFWLHREVAMSRCDVWNPSENIEDAWMVVEKMRSKICIEINAWEQGFFCGINPYYDEYDFDARASTAPLAICRAILKSIL